jgi:hypothetical protein
MLPAAPQPPQCIVSRTPERERSPFLIDSYFAEIAPPNDLAGGIGCPAAGHAADPLAKGFLLTKRFPCCTMRWSAFQLGRQTRRHRDYNSAQGFQLWRCAREEYYV